MLRYFELGCKVHNILIRLEEPAECLGYTLKWSENADFCYEIKVARLVNIKLSFMDLLSL